MDSLSRYLTDAVRRAYLQSDRTGSVLSWAMKAGAELEASGALPADAAGIRRRMLADRLRSLVDFEVVAAELIAADLEADRLLAEIGEK